MDTNYSVIVGRPAEFAECLYAGARLADALRALDVFLLFAPGTWAKVYAYDMTAYRDVGVVLKVRDGRWSVPTPAACREAA